jgi:hypothetical protein
VSGSRSFTVTPATPKPRRVPPQPHPSTRHHRPYQHHRHQDREATATMAPGGQSARCHFSIRGPRSLARILRTLSTPQFRTLYVVRALYTPRWRIGANKAQKPRADLLPSLCVSTSLPWKAEPHRRIPGSLKPPHLGHLELLAHIFLRTNDLTIGAMLVPLGSGTCTKDSATVNGRTFRLGKI